MLGKITMDINSLKTGSPLVGNSYAESKFAGRVQAEPSQPERQVQSPPAKKDKELGIRIMTYNVKSMTSAEFDAAINHAITASYDITNPITDLVAPYQQTLQELSKADPLLASKDWDLGINNGELIVIQGSDSLSLKEINLLEKSFDQPVFTKNLKAFQDAVIEATKGDIRLDKKPGAVAHYNLNNDNINDVVRPREFIIQESKHQFQSLESLREQLLERGSDFIKQEAADMKLVDVFA